MKDEKTLVIYDSETKELVAVLPLELLLNVGKRSVTGIIFNDVEPVFIERDDRLFIDTSACIVRPEGMEDEL